MRQVTKQFLVTARHVVVGDEGSPRADLLAQFPPDEGLSVRETVRRGPAAAPKLGAVLVPWCRAGGPRVLLGVRLAFWIRGSVNPEAVER